jgi:hypothetical protein
MIYNNLGNDHLTSVAKFERKNLDLKDSKQIFRPYNFQQEIFGWYLIIFITLTISIFSLHFAKNFLLKIVRSKNLF